MGIHQQAHIKADDGKAPLSLLLKYMKIAPQ